MYVYVVEPGSRRIIGCERCNYPQMESLQNQMEEMLRLMIQKAGFNPDLIDWAGIEEEVVGRMAKELV